MYLKTCHEILILELIGVSCIQQRVGSVHYQFKLPEQHYLKIWKSLSGKENDEYALNKIRGEIFHGFAVI